VRIHTILHLRTRAREAPRCVLPAQAVRMHHGTRTGSMRLTAAVFRRQQGAPAPLATAASVKVAAAPKQAGVKKSSSMFGSIFSSKKTNQ
jgi:hypothetical protein